METIDKQFSNSELTISTQNKNHLQEAAKWAYFLAIVGFVGLGLMVVGGLVVMMVGTTVAGVGEMGAAGIIYLIMAVLYFFPTYYLFIFAQKIKSACASGSQSDMDTGLENLKSLFKFLGIMTIVVISLYLLMFLVGIVAIAAIR
jgi:hypothetical protein